LRLPPPKLVVTPASSRRLIIIIIIIIKRQFIRRSNMARITTKLSCYCNWYVVLLFRPYADRQVSKWTLLVNGADTAVDSVTAVKYTVEGCFVLFCLIVRRYDCVTCVQATQNNALSVSLDAGKLVVMHVVNGQRTTLETNVDTYSDGTWHYMTLTKDGRKSVGSSHSRAHLHTWPHPWSRPFYSTVVSVCVCCEKDIRVWLVGTEALGRQLPDHHVSASFGEPRPSLSALSRSSWPGSSCNQDRPLRSS